MIHQYKLKGYNIVLDAVSGAVHAVNDVAYDIIEMYQTHSHEEIMNEMLKRYGDIVDSKDISECFDDIEELKKQKQLFTEEDYSGLASAFKQKSGNVIKALCLHVAHTCNLNCSYCFASQGKFHGERALMSFEVGKRALDFLVENSGSRQKFSFHTHHKRRADRR